MYVCEREREREREKRTCLRECVGGFVCVIYQEKEKVCVLDGERERCLIAGVCLCVCKREREREKERE